METRGPGGRGLAPGPYPQKFPARLTQPFLNHIEPKRGGFSRAGEVQPLYWPGGVTTLAKGTYAWPEPPVPTGLAPAM